MEFAWDAQGRVVMRRSARAQAIEVGGQVEVDVVCERHVARVPAPGPKSMIQSACAMTACWCAMTITDLLESTRVRPRGPCWFRSWAQLTAFFTSAPIFVSSAAVNSVSAKATGHMAPLSRFASSLKPKVAYLVLNFCALWK